MSELVKVDETALQAKLLELQQKVDILATQIPKQMPDDIRQKLKDVLNWVITNL